MKPADLRLAVNLRQFACALAQAHPLLLCIPLFYSCSSKQKLMNESTNKNRARGRQTTLSSIAEHPTEALFPVLSHSSAGTLSSLPVQTPYYSLFARRCSAHTVSTATATSTSTSTSTSLALLLSRSLAAPPQLLGGPAQAVAAQRRAALPCHAMSCPAMSRH